MASDEQYGFVFAVTFIILFSVLLTTIPVDFQGLGETPDMLIPLEPSTVTGFSDYEDYQKSNFSTVGSLLYFEYNDLAGRNWKCEFADSAFSLGAKIFYGGFIFLGTVDSVKFTSTEGVNRDNTLSFTEIDADADDGVIRYNLQYYANGASAGGLVFYWNITTYGNSSSAAWAANALFIVHGVGIADTARGDAGALLIQLLFLQLPEVPLLVNILLITPIWACIVFVLWFIIKESIPFV